MERIPRIGESLQFANLKFTIRKADQRSIKEVLITISDASEEIGDKTD
jgi:CBS domain containing-hemolysin-like protein